MPNPRAITGLVVVLSAFRALAQPQPHAPDPATLVAAAKNTFNKLQSTSASWQLIIDFNPNVALTADVLHTPAGRRLIFQVREKGRVTELARIIETPNTWYVSQDGRHEKHRAFEAEFTFPVVSLAHAHADPNLVTADAPQRFGPPKSIDGNFIHYTVPHPNAAGLRNILRQYDDTLKSNPQLVEKNPGLQRNMDQIRDMLEHGAPLTIDASTGMLTQFTGGKYTVHIADFRWLDAVPQPEFKTDDHPWTDFTDDPTSGNLNDLTMITHYAAWRPGDPGKDTDALLLDITTGRSRRVPYRGPAAVPGCFLKDRTSVIVSGLDMNQGGLQLFEINLKTGANRKLGGDVLSNGNTLMPALSPDGKTLAALYKSNQGQILNCQVVIIDLASGDAKLIGQPFDGAFLNWLPDATGFILLKREYKDLNQPSTDVICRMDLQGNFTPICKGHSPIVLKDGKTLVFEHPEGRKWHTCNLDATNPRPIGDGLPKHGFPTQSPDGKRLLMMSFTPDQGPRPVLIDLATGQSQPLNVGPGLWAMPAWQ